MIRLIAASAALILGVAAPAAAPLNVRFEAAARAVLAKAGAPETEAPNLFFTTSGKVYVLSAVERGNKTGLGVFVSTDGGDSFAPPFDVAPDASSAPMTHGEMAPVFVREPANTQMYALWQDNNGLNVASASLFGRAFGKPVDVVPTATGTRFNGGFATLGVAPSGDLYAAWLDGHEKPEHPGTFDVRVARSTDKGATFGAPVRVARSACPCCRPSIAFDENGVLYLSWRQDFPGEFRDIVVATSRDNGSSWTSPARVNADGWSIRGCPDSGPALFAHNGTLDVAWFTAGSTGRAQVRASSSTDGVHFTPAVTISGNVYDANHPKFAEGPAPYPIVVFEGRDPKGAGFGVTHAFLTAYRDGKWTAPQAIPAGAGGMAGPVAAMKDAGTIYVAGTANSSRGPSVLLVRGRLP